MACNVCINFSFSLFLYSFGKKKQNKTRRREELYVRECTKKIHLGCLWEIETFLCLMKRRQEQGKKKRKQTIGGFKEKSTSVGSLSRWENKIIKSCVWYINQKMEKFSCTYLGIYVYVHANVKRLQQYTHNAVLWRKVRMEKVLFYFSVGSFLKNSLNLVLIKLSFGLLNFSIQ
jgi:hypothetical protein